VGTRVALLAVLVVSGVTLAARALFGPGSLPFHVNSPMNVEGVVALAFLALLLTGDTASQGAGQETGHETGHETGQETKTRGIGINLPTGAWAALLGICIVAAFSRYLDFPLLADDYSHIWHARHADARALWAHFSVPEEDHFFRPAAYLSYALDALWAGYSRTAWRAGALAFHIINSLLVFWLCCEIGCRRVGAFLGALIFGLHGSRPEAVTWVAARFDLLAVMFALACILAVLRRASAVLSGLLLTLALLSKESAYVTPLLIASILWFRGTKWGEIARRIAPLLGIETLTFLYRFWLLKGIGGYHSAASGSPTILQFRFTSTLKALFPRFWGAMIFPLNWTGGLAVPLRFSLAAAVCALGYLAWRGADRRKVLLGIGIATICSLPVHQFLSIGPDLEKSRVIYFASVGLAVLFAAVFERMDGRLTACAILYLGFQCIALESNLAHWKRVGYLAERACQVGAQALRATSRPIAAVGLPNVVDGVYFLHTGFAECVLFLAPEGTGRVLASPREGARVLTWDEGSRTLKARAD
jgi:hypothetical protein